MKASDAFVRQLEEEGVQYVFALPGEENLDLLESLRTSSIKVIITRHEQAAAFMAATVGRLTGRAGVCLSTLGPGATNLVTGIAHAQLIGAPMVSISGQKAMRNNWQGTFQIVDIPSLMRPITKKSLSVSDPNTVPTSLREAFKIAETERPGVVHVELPEDVAELDCVAPVQRRGSYRMPAPDPDALAAAAELINNARRPVIVLSSGANRHRVRSALNTFIAHSGMYVVHTQMGKGVVPADCIYSLYATGIHKQDFVNCGNDQADLIIPVGYNIVEYPPYVWNPHGKKTILNIDFVPAATDRYFNPQVEVLGDIAATFTALSRLVTPNREFPLFRRTRELLDGKLAEQVPVQYPLHPAGVVRSVRRVLAYEDIVTLDNGIYKLWFARMYKAYHPNTMLLDNALATMGAGFSMALAAKLLNPQRKGLAVCGDGGFMMNSQELETALRMKLPVVALILRDNAYGFIKWKQQDKNLQDFGLDFGNPDFVAYANSYGAKGFRVGPDDDLVEVLNAAFLCDTVAVVDCPIDYSMNYEVFSKELASLVCA